MSEHVVLFRDSLSEEGELQCCEQFFDTYRSRCSIPPDSIVIGRYSVLPYYNELCDDLLVRNSYLINSKEQHKFLADCLRWSECVKPLTPRSYTEWGWLPEGSYVVKGRTNSRKHQWNTHMFAKNKQELLKVTARLLDDTMIREQGLVVRDYIRLEKLEEAINGLPISNEWRFFFCYGKLIEYGFYWANFPELNPKFESNAYKCATKASDLIRSYANFYSIDVAKDIYGHWWVIDINDGCMSGLATIEPLDFYSNLSVMIGPVMAGHK